MNNVEDLPVVLRYVRDVRGVSQAEVAERTGVAESTIQRIEDGKVDPQRMTIGVVKALEDWLR